MDSNKSVTLSILATPTQGKDNLRFQIRFIFAKLSYRDKKQRCYVKPIFALPGKSSLLERVAEGKEHSDAAMRLREHCRENAEDKEKTCTVCLGWELE